MTVYYLDSSALIKRYRDEKGTEVLDALFENKNNSEAITTSLFTVLEITSVATRLLRANNISQSAYGQLIGEISKDFNQTIVAQSISDTTLSEAIALITAYGLKAPDAIQSASALVVRSKLTGQDVYFLCSDSRLNAACISEGLLVLNPESDGSINALRIIRIGNR